MCIYPSYTYLIGWSNRDLWYYGVRLGNRCMPSEDLWQKYFTSSKLVKKYRTEFGEPDIIEVRKTFINNKDAIDWEIKVLKRLQVLKKNKWLNRSIAGAIAPMYGYCHPRYGDITQDSVKEQISKKAKQRYLSGIKNPMYSRKHRNESIDLMSKNRKGMTAGEKNPMYNKKHTNETKEKISLKIKEAGGRKGKNNPMYGKTHKESTRKILSEKNKGIQSNNFKGYFMTPWGEFASTVEAAENAPCKLAGWTISRWCKKDNLKIINRTSIAKSKFLQEKDNGKSFKEIGFDFLPADNIR